MMKKSTERTASLLIGQAATRLAFSAGIHHRFGETDLLSDSDCLPIYRATAWRRHRFQCHPSFRLTGRVS
jgi:hypothetical protein